jgi:hypothetical protein
VRRAGPLCTSCKCRASSQGCKENFGQLLSTFCAADASSGSRRTGIFTAAIVGRDAPFLAFFEPPPGRQNRTRPEGPSYEEVALLVT